MTILRVIRAATIAALVPAWLGCGHADDHEANDTHEHGMAGHAPHFCASPTTTAVASGSWSNPAIWSKGKVPAAGDVVAIDEGRSVTYDVKSDAALRAVCVEGALRARSDASTRLTVGTLQIMAGGTLEIGTAAKPIAATVTAEVVIADQVIDSTDDPQQFGTGLIGEGTVTFHGAPRTPTFVRLATAPAAGATKLELTEAPTGWRAGDKLVLPDTRQTPIKKGLTPKYEQLEEMTVASVSGTAVTLTAPLQFSHLGEAELRPHVANLTRNVIVRSANPDGTRGHVLMTGRAAVDLRHAAFLDLGRTTVQSPDDAVFNDDGTVLSIATNQIGRYSLHFHHLHGPINPTNTGYQYRAVGNVIAGGLKWGLVMHQSHFGYVADNVAYRIQGAGFATEDGNEAHNEVVHNFAVHIVSAKVDHSRGGVDGVGGNPAGNTGFSGDGFWNRGPHNYLRGNVAANTSFSGYNYNGYYLRSAWVPKVRGADPSDRSQWLVYSHQNIKGVEGEIYENIPLLEARDNEAYATNIGLWITWPGMTIGVAKYVHESVIDKFTAWHMQRAGIETYHVSHFTYKDIRLLNDPKVSQQNQGNSRIGRGFAFDSPSYENGKVVVVDAEVRGYNIGIALPQNLHNDEFPAQHTTTMTGLTLENYVNVSDNLPNTEKKTELVDVTFLTSTMTAIPGLPASPTHVWMRYAVGNPNGGVRILQPTSLTIESSSIGSMQVYFLEQSPEFVVPQSSDPKKGYPVSGLTNAQGWAAYGSVVGGEMAPKGAQQRPDVVGYVVDL